MKFRSRSALVCSWAALAFAGAGCSSDEEAPGKPAVRGGAGAASAGRGGSGGSTGGSTGGAAAGRGGAGTGGSSGGATAGRGGAGGSPEAGRGGGDQGGTAGSKAGGGNGGSGDTSSTCPEDPPDGLPSGPMTRSSENPIMKNGPDAYDFDKAGPRVIIKVGAGDYRMWYEAVASGLRTVIAYATSEDGLVWEKQGPVMEPESDWEANEVSPNSILREDGVFKLWYHGGGSESDHRNTGYATSSDGLNWTRLPDPVLMVGPAGDFDDDEAVDARVFNLGDEYRMYYTGAQEGTREKALGMATSPDGIEWTKDQRNPILETDVWGNYWGGAFFFEGGLWHLWHASDEGQGRLEYMWSLDGVEWEEGEDNPVLVPSGDTDGPDESYIGDSVSGYRDGDEYRITYSGYAENLFGSEGRFEGICMATVAATCPP
jgi:predicted GH43/DUF377 family glycosyl hydrolase